MYEAPYSRRKTALVNCSTSTFLTWASGAVSRRASSTASAARRCPAPTEADRIRMRRDMTDRSFRKRGVAVTVSSRLADDGDDDVALARVDVALQVEDLLPRPQHRLAAGDGDGQRRAEDGRLQVRVAVAVVPGLLVAVLPRRREQPVQGRRQVAAQARLELDGADR